ncbi:MAG: hypothetical protein ABW321_13120 [Polyangiales bacterium]
MFSKPKTVIAWLLIAGCSDTTESEIKAEPPRNAAAGSGSSHPGLVPTPPATPGIHTPQVAPDDVPRNPPACAPAAAGLADADVITLVAQDAAKLDPEAKSQTLYVSLSHLADSHDECDMRFYRYGIGQLANMMSWAPSIVATQFIDPQSYVARIDVRALAWEPDALPYMLTAVKRADYGVLSATPGEPAVVRGDWLAQQMTRPPVYGYIMRNQLFEREMEAQAKVDNSKPGQLGGVYQSIVAQNPRILERRESEYGACWISHDFLYRTQATAALETGELPQDDLRFVAQQYIAREYICALPNGMQSYQVTGFVSQRRWDANTCVAQNPSRQDKRVINGQCFSCHTDGLIRFKDMVRGGKTDPSEHIKAFYPAQNELDALFDQDNARYTQAVSQIPYYDAAFTTPLNQMIAVYAQRSGDDLIESSAGTFGAFLYNSASGGPIWDDVINPIASSAVGLGILLPGAFLYEDIPELVIPELQALYDAHGVDENAECLAD